MQPLAMSYVYEGTLASYSMIIHPGCLADLTQYKVGQELRKVGNSYSDSHHHLLSFIVYLIGHSYFVYRQGEKGTEATSN